MRLGPLTNLGKMAKKLIKRKTEIEREEWYEKT